MSNSLVNKKYTLQKFPGKGGWTYAMIPEIPQDKKSPFGWVRVKCSIDGHSFHDYRLMPMGNGFLFLPVKAALSRIISKEAEDIVQVILFKWCFKAKGYQNKTYGMASTNYKAGI